MRLMRTARVPDKRTSMSSKNAEGSALSQVEKGRRKAKKR